MATILINTIPYTVYGSLLGAVPPPVAPDPTHVGIDTYMNGSAQKAAYWSANVTTDDARGRLLVDATRMLDGIAWAGTKTSPTQALAWPRTGVVRADGTAVDPLFYPIEIVHAAYELAFAILVDPDIVDSGGSTASNIKRVKAGTAEVEFMGRSSGLPLPKSAWSLVSMFAASAAGSGVGFGFALGTCEESQFDGDEDFFKVGRP